MADEPSPPQPDQRSIERELVQALSERAYGGGVISQNDFDDALRSLYGIRAGTIDASQIQAGSFTANFDWVPLGAPGSRVQPRCDHIFNLNADTCDKCGIGIEDWTRSVRACRHEWTSVDEYEYCAKCMCSKQLIADLDFLVADFQKRKAFRPIPVAGEEAAREEMEVLPEIYNDRDYDQREV